MVTGLMALVALRASVIRGTIISWATTLKRLGACTVLFAGMAGPSIANGAKGDLWVSSQQTSQAHIVDYGLVTGPHIEPSPYTVDEGYDFELFASQVTSIPFEVTGVLGLTVAMGLVDWDWGSSSFHVTPEGFFGDDTKNGGMDKIGHAWSAALISDFFTDRIRETAADPQDAAVTGAILSMGVMVGIEVFDGFAGEHGFSPEDIVADAVGVAFSYFRNTIPGFKEKVDFRMEYVPSGNQFAFAPQSDYSGQKYLLALKLAGFETFRDTPMRFIEFQAGYFARGFTQKEQKNGDHKQQEVYFAVGINLQELLFGHYADDEPRLKTYGRRFFEYVQVPYSYATYNSRAYDY